MTAKNITLCLTTLNALLKEAEKNSKHFTREFRKWDNSEDMHTMEHWGATVDWIKKKIEESSEGK